MLRSFLKDETGMGTIEVVVIVGVLVGLALVFKDGINAFLQQLMQRFFQVPE